MGGPWLSPDRASEGSPLCWFFQEGLFTLSLLPLQDVAVGTEDSPEDSISSAPAILTQLTWTDIPEVSAGWPCPIWQGSLNITYRVGSYSHHSSCSCASLMARRIAACLVCSQRCDRVLHTRTQDSSTEKHRRIPAAHGQRSSAPEWARSRSPQWDRNLRSWLVDTTDYEPSRGRRRTGPRCCHHAARDEAALGPSNSSSQFSPAPSTASEQTLPGQREQSRSLGQDYGLRSWFMEHTDCHHSARRKSRRRARRPHHDRAPRWRATHKASREETLLRQRERSRSPRWGCDLHSRFEDITDHDPSAGRRRRRRRRASVPRRSRLD